MQEIIPNITVLGGGTGTKNVLAGLGQHEVNLSAVMNMSDDGGSTGQLRRELGVMPPGDIRQAIVALSEAPKDVVELFETRFPESSPLHGHSFGNLIIAAAELVEGDFARAVDRVSSHMQVKGEVIPVTLDLHDLVMQVAGTTVRGEFNIGGAEMSPLETPPELWLEPRAELAPEAEKVLLNTDMIVIAPGDLYGSLIPILLTEGIQDALLDTSARIVYVANLVNKPHQTKGFGPSDYVRELERAAGIQCIDTVAYNGSALTPEFLAAYGKDGEEPLEPIDVSDTHRTYVASDLVARCVKKPQVEGPIQRSYIRHDPAKLAQTILRLL